MCVCVQEERRHTHTHTQTQTHTDTHRHTIIFISNTMLTLPPPFNRLHLSDHQTVLATHESEGEVIISFRREAARDFDATPAQFRIIYRSSKVLRARECCGWTGGKRRRRRRRG